MQSPKSDVCVICGIRAATTHDHVPPKCFFKGSKGAALVTVPACAPCNNGASADDEDMRFYMSMQVGKKTLESSRLWEQGARKSVMRKTALRNHVVGTGRAMQFVGEDGRSVSRLAVEAPVTLYEVVFSRTVRGLYFFHTARILSPDCQTKVSPLVLQPEDPLIKELHYNEIGGHACKYWYGVDSEDLDGSLWLFQFYGAHWIQVTTGAVCDEDA